MKKIFNTRIWPINFSCRKKAVSCNLSYIPARLVWGGRPIVQSFKIGEKLFRRCKEEERENPFDSISLVDLSLNRGGDEEFQFSLPKDVLYNTNPTETKTQQVFDEEVVVALEIKELDAQSQYRKLFYEPVGNQNEEQLYGQFCCEIFLRHKPDDCNYSHCSFEFYYKGEEVTWKNYKTTLGKGNSETRKLRTKCKYEISRMIIKEEVRINFD